MLTEADLDLEVPGYTFRPNIWTEAFLTGLQTIPLAGKKVLEIGVGTGIIAIDLLKRGVQQYTGVDIDERVLPVAQRNIAKKIPLAAALVTLLQSDLLESLPQGEYYDLICGCLPQVGKPATVELGNEDSFARYFDEDKYESVLNVYGLGLNENALTQAKSRLRPDGSIVLVLSGRAGKNVLETLFNSKGYKPRIVFEDTIAQLRETTLATLVDSEAQGYEFFFYKDEFCRERISVREAEERRIHGEDSYHKIYVVEGRSGNHLS